MLDKALYTLRHPSSDPLGFCGITGLFLAIALSCFFGVSESRIAMTWALGITLLLMVVLWLPLIMQVLLHERRKRK